MDMCSSLTILLFVFAFYSYTPVAAEGLCNITCGKGSCNPSSAGFLQDIIPRCQCDSGWKQPTIGISLPFLPCVIPKCTIDASCSQKAPSSSGILPPLLPLPTNPTDLLNPCAFSVCGEGSCEKTSKYEYRCNCEGGYENLLNMRSGPCVKQCSIGADCSRLGINLPGIGKATPRPSQSDTSAKNNKGAEKGIPCWISMAFLSLSCLSLLR